MDITAFLNRNSGFELERLIIHRTGLQEGSVLNGTVLDVLANGKVRIDFGRFRALAETRFPVQKGDILPVQVTASGKQLVLQLIPSQAATPGLGLDETTANAPGTAFFQRLNLQIEQLLAARHRPAGPPLPPVLRNALGKIAQHLTPLELTENPDRLAELLKLRIEKGGLFFETHLQRFLLEAEPGKFTPFELPGPLKQDLKANLNLILAYDRQSSLIKRPESYTLPDPIRTQLESLFNEIHSRQRHFFRSVNTGPELPSSTDGTTALDGESGPGGRLQQNAMTRLSTWMSRLIRQPENQSALSRPISGPSNAFQTPPETTSAKDSDRNSPPVRLPSELLKLEALVEATRPTDARIQNARQSVLDAIADSSRSESGQAAPDRDTRMRNLQSRLFHLYSFYLKPGGEKAADEAEFVRRLRSSMEYLSTRPETLRRPVAETVRDTEPMQMATISLVFKQIERPSTFRIYYPPRSETARPGFRVTVLLKLDRLGDLRSDFFLHDGRLEIKFFVRNESVKRTMERRMSRLQTALGNRFKSVSFYTVIAVDADLVTAPADSDSNERQIDVKV